MRRIGKLSREIVEYIDRYLAAGYSLVFLYPLQQKNETWVCTCEKGESCPSPGKHPPYAWKGRGIRNYRVIYKEPIKSFIEKAGNTNPNLAVVTGEPYGESSTSYLAVLDIDNEEALKQLKQILPPGVQKEIRDNPDCLVKTRRGYHIYFLTSEPLPTVISLLDGVDLKGIRGYVVAPPSRHIGGGQYKTLGKSPIPLPLIPSVGDEIANVVKRLVDQRKRNSTPETNDSPLKVQLSREELLQEAVIFLKNKHLHNRPFIPQGERNNTLTSTAGFIRYLGADYDDILHVLKELNYKFCNPPLEEREIENITKSISKYPAGNGSIKKEITFAEALYRYLHDIIKHPVLTRIVKIWGRSGSDIYRLHPSLPLLDYTLKNEDLDSEIYTTLTELYRDDPSFRTLLRVYNKKEPVLLWASNIRRIHLTNLTPIKLDEQNTQYKILAMNGVIDIKEYKITDDNTLFMAQSSYPFTPIWTNKQGKFLSPDEVKTYVPHFYKFLHDFTCGDENYLIYLLAVLAYPLLGAPLFRQAYFLWGFGNNGKSTLLTILREVLGQLFISIPTSALTGQDSNHYALANIAHARFYHVLELKDKDKLEAETIKMLTTGEKTKITVRQIYQAPREVLVEGVPFFETNHLPQFQTFDNAIFNRIVILPAKNYVPPSQADPQLATRIVQTEGEKIFNLLVYFAHCVSRHGLPQQPNVVQQANRHYRESVDELLGFVESKVEITRREADVIKFTELYQCYVDWCTEMGEEPVKERTFRRRLEKFYGLPILRGRELGYKGKEGRALYVLCIRYKDDSEDPQLPPSPPTGDNKEQHKGVVESKYERTKELYTQGQEDDKIKDLFERHGFEEVTDKSPPNEEYINTDDWGKDLDEGIQQTIGML